MKLKIIVLFMVIVFLVTSAFIFANIMAVSLRSPVVNSLKRAGLKSAHICFSLEKRELFNIQDSVKMTWITKTWYDREGNASIIVSHNVKYDSTVFTYDSMGNILKAIEYDAAGLVSGMDTHIFNTNDKVLESRYFDKNNDLWCKRSYAYNESGELIQETSWARDWPSWRHTETFEYDSLGNLVRDSSKNYILIATYDTKGKILSGQSITDHDTTVSVYQYSENKHEKCVEIKENGHICRRSTERFDSLGRTVEKIDDNCSLKTIYIKESSYGNSGKTERGRTLDSLGILKYSHFKLYDSNDNLLKNIEYDSTGNVIKQETIIYDRNGNIIMYECIDRNKYYGRINESPDITRWTYEYYKH
jgi:hypothetical protein